MIELRPKENFRRLSVFVVECDNSPGEFSVSMCFSDKSVIDFVVRERCHCDGSRGKVMLAFQSKMG